MNRIYLDYAASAPADKAVLSAMLPYFREKFGNAGSLHPYGQEASSALDASRESIASAIGADFRQIVFTESATESNNLALRGALKKYMVTRGEKFPARIVVSPVEHPSVLKTAQMLSEEGAEIALLPVDSDGAINENSLDAMLTKHTAIVSVMYANNEIGTIEPIRAIAQKIKKFREAQKSQYPLFHTDAAQAMQYLPCKADDLGIDLMTISSHKIYGPKGISALYVRDASLLSPILIGGMREFGLRAGTENVPGAVGLAEAVKLVEKRREKERERVFNLRNALWMKIKNSGIAAEINGPDPLADASDRLRRLPNNLNIYFKDFKAEDVIARLGARGVSVSGGSACAARATKPSHVVLACGFDKARAERSVRISLGVPTTRREIDEAAKRIIMSLKAPSSSPA